MDVGTTTIEFHMALGAIPIIAKVMMTDHEFGSRLAYEALTTEPCGMPADEFIAAAYWYADKATENGDTGSATKFRACAHIGEYARSLAEDRERRA